MLVALLLACATDPHGPRPIAWDHAACDHCGMLISDPRYGAEIVARDGTVLEFDDPACLFRHIEQHPMPIRDVYFRDAQASEDVWLSSMAVSFVADDGAPMDGGLAAVPAGTPGALSFGEASSRVLGGAR